MTTVAFTKNEIAADTMITMGGRFCGEYNKIGKIKGLLYGAAGSVAFSQNFYRWVRDGMSKDNYPQMGQWGGTNALGIVVFGDVIFALDPDGLTMTRAKAYAIGSGAQFALGAMAAGKSARQAVKIAALYDCHTGSDVMSLRADA